MESEQQRGEIPFSSQIEGGFGMSQPVNNHSAYMVQMTDHTDNLDDFYLKLMGRGRDENGKVIISPYGTQLMNQKGAAKITSLLSTSLNDVTDMSSLSQDEIQNLSWSNMEALMSQLAENRILFDIKTDADRSTIMSMFYNYLTAVLNRAHMDRLNDKKFFGRITQEQVNNVNSQTDASKGFFSKLNPLK